MTTSALGPSSPCSSTSTTSSPSPLQMSTDGSQIRVLLSSAQSISLSSLISSSSAAMSTLPTSSSTMSVSSSSSSSSGAETVAKLHAKILGTPSQLSGKINLLKGLQQLTLSNNQLRSLPKEIGAVTTFQNSDPFTYFHSIPLRTVNSFDPSTVFVENKILQVAVMWVAEKLEKEDHRLQLTYDFDNKVFTIQNSSNISVPHIKKLFQDTVHPFGWAPNLLDATDIHGNKQFILVRE